MSEEWLDPVRMSEESVADVVLRRRHEAAYEFAGRFAGGRRVVDVACGVGYGARILGDRPASYVGIDRSVRALQTTVSRLPSRRVAFVAGDAIGELPLRDGCAALVLAFQVIEHVRETEAPMFLEELRRICRPEGRVVFTTPNRVHRLLPFQPPWNPYHAREFRREELGKLLRESFREVSLLGLRADEPIEAVERARVHQHPVTAYGSWILRTLPASIADSVRAGLGRLRSTRSPSSGGSGSDLKPGVVTRDRFRVEDDKDGAGLDLVAVCRP